MSNDLRRQVVVSRFERTGASHQHDEINTKLQYPSEVLGENVFTLKAMAKALPKPVFANFLKQRKGGRTLDKVTADAIAHAVRVWAMDKGATHFTHWFQPQTDTTAEKHDSFLSLATSYTPGGVETVPMDIFSGGQLLQSEPDASSFPSGGMRSTFEARGYTVWDTSSPMFIRKGTRGTCVLYVPSVFISYNGEALDEKTILLRSNEALSSAACKLLALIKPDNMPKHVFTTLGTEQEFFLIDRALYSLRPDLKITGRTLVGKLPPRHQQLENNYFGKIPGRVMHVISEVEVECMKLGVPLKTRHNEVAPAQFELAPVFEESAVAVDHNLLVMDMLHQVAHKHNLRALFHEKPFDGVNGSGKHCNWSISTETGENLLDPTVRPETNYQFILILLAVLKGVMDHAPLLRASISSASNEHRLGANEAPPGIISVFLGDQLSEVLDSLEEKRPIKNFSVPQFQAIKVGGTLIDFKVAALPTISRDLTDRNRTSPFAFTGNKFEFRAVGSKQSPSFPVSVVNCAVASALQDITQDLQATARGTQRLTEEDILSVIRKYIAITKPIRFEGDNYSEEWVVEAASRGLPNIKTSPEAFAALCDPAQTKMLTEKLQVFTATELESRYSILNERYFKDIMIEAETISNMMHQIVLPAAFQARKELADSAVSMKSNDADYSSELQILETFKPMVAGLIKSVAELDKVKMEVAEHKSDDPAVHATLANTKVKPAIESIRKFADEIEGICPDRFWSLPKYTELMFAL